MTNPKLDEAALEKARNRPNNDSDLFVIYRDDKGKFVLAPHTRLINAFAAGEAAGHHQLFLRLVPEAERIDYEHRY